MNVKCRVWSKRDKKYFNTSDLGSVGAWLVMAYMDKRNYTVEMFSGTKDSKGRDIYEGDKIVCYFQRDGDHWNHMTGKSTGTVKFDKNLAQFRVFFKGRNGRMDNMSLEKHHDHVVILK